MDIRQTILIVLLLQNESVINNGSDRIYALVRNVQREISWAWN